MKADLFIGANQSARTAFILLSAANVILGLVLLITIVTLSGRETVVRMPPPLTNGKEVMVGQSWASDAYIESWSWWVSNLMGNLSSENIDDSVVMLSRLMTDRLHRDMRESMRASVETMRVQGFRLSFAPERVVFDPNSSKVYVVGRMTETPVRGEPSTMRWTYEMEWVVRFGLPRLNEIRGYEGDAPRFRSSRR